MISKIIKIIFLVCIWFVMTALLAEIWEPLFASLISLIIATSVTYLLQKLQPNSKKTENKVQLEEDLKMVSETETKEKSNKIPLSSAEKLDEAIKIAGKASEKFNEYENKLLDENNDYPVMQLLGKIYNVLAMICALAGVLFAVAMLVEFNIGLAFLSLLFGALFFLICKLFSELTRIIADIASYLKTIRNNTISLKK
jgi:Flp pilus assembly protein TadB